MIYANVIGNLGNDAELRTTPGGKVVCGFSVATKGRDRDAPPTWVRASVWGVRAEKLVAYLKKGTYVSIWGTLSTHEYNGKTQVDLDVNEVQLLSGGTGRPREEHPQQPPIARAGATRRAPQQRNLGGDDDSEVPF